MASISFTVNDIDPTTYIYFLKEVRENIATTPVAAQTAAAQALNKAVHVAILDRIRLDQITPVEANDITINHSLVLTQKDASNVVTFSIHESFYKADAVFKAALKDDNNHIYYTGEHKFKSASTAELQAGGPEIMRRSFGNNAASTPHPLAGHFASRTASTTTAAQNPPPSSSRSIFPESCLCILQ